MIGKKCILRKALRDEKKLSEIERTERSQPQGETFEDLSETAELSPTLTVQTSKNERRLSRILCLHSAERQDSVLSQSRMSSSELPQLEIRSKFQWLLQFFRAFRPCPLTAHSFCRSK